MFPTMAVGKIYVAFPAPTNGKAVVSRMWNAYAGWNVSKKT